MVDHPVSGIPGHSGVRIPPPVIYAGIFALGYVLQRFFPIAEFPKTMSHVLAIICTGAAAFLGTWSLLWFWRAHTSPLPHRPSKTLVTTGPYHLTRNPMYVSLAFLYGGMTFWLQAAWALLLLPVVILMIRYFVIDREEHYLSLKFGQEYLRYKMRVRRWL